MSGGDLFDDNEFGGSAYAIDTPAWVMAGDHPGGAATLVPSSNSLQNVQDDSFNAINDDDEFLLNAFSAGGQGENGPIASGAENTYEPPTIAFTTTTVEQRSSVDHQAPTAAGKAFPPIGTTGTIIDQGAAVPSTALREWEIQHETQLEQKRIAEEQFKDGRKQEAQKQLAEWYKERDARLQRNREQNRIKDAQELKARQAAESSQLPSNSSASWGKVWELIEIQSDSASLAAASSKLAMQSEAKAATAGGKTKGLQASTTVNGAGSAAAAASKTPQPDVKDTSRMRQVLLELKTNGSNSSSNVTTSSAAALNGLLPGHN